MIASLLRSHSVVIPPSHDASDYLTRKSNSRLFAARTGPAARCAPRRVFTVRADKGDKGLKGDDKQAKKPEQG